MPSPSSGTFIVEAAIATLTGRRDKLLVLVNAAYSERLAAIARRLNWPAEILSWPEDRPVAPAVIELTLDADRRIPVIALIASGNKCLECVPGLGFALVEQAALAGSRGKLPSLSLDFHYQ